MGKLRNIFVVLMMVVVAACADSSSDPVEVIASAKYVSEEAPSITLLTMVGDDGGFAEHTGILINASQQVLYDPAGSFRHRRLARARDVHYGVTPVLDDYYRRYHARFGYYVVAQKIEVTAEVAEEAFRRAVAQGTTGQLRCGLSASTVLNGLFPNVPVTYYPGKIMRNFGEIPGVHTSYTRENDIGQNHVD